jgi:hypothetical protein
MNLVYSIAMAFTFHTSSYPYNGFNPSFRVESNNVIMGAYYNSVDRVSFYLGKRIQPNKAYIEFGAVTGYVYTVIPMILAGYQFNETTSVFFSPVIDSYGLTGLAGIEFRF